MKNKDLLLEKFEDFKITKNNLTKTNGGETTYAWVCTQKPGVGSDDYEVITDICIYK